MVRLIDGGCLAAEFLFEDCRGGFGRDEPGSASKQPDGSTGDDEQSDEEDDEGEWGEEVPVGVGSGSEEVSDTGTEVGME